MPTAQQIDAILPFLERFEAAGIDFDAVVPEFVQALYEHGWVSPAFDWTEWQQSAQEFVDSPRKVEKADAAVIQKLLTTHVRTDRFCEGHLASMFENGHIGALLRRLQTIRAKMNS
jgi:hypothetical protein